MFCCTLLYVPSSFAIILMGKREMVALLSLSSWLLVIVVWLFLGVPWGCLQFVIVVFPDHTHYFRCNSLKMKKDAKRKYFQAQRHGEQSVVLDGNNHCVVSKSQQKWFYDEKRDGLDDEITRN